MSLYETTYGPIKSANSVSIYELSKKIDSLCKITTNMSSEIRNLSGLDKFYKSITNENNENVTVLQEKVINELVIKLNNQQKEIDDQKNKINSLEERLNKLENDK
jgi:hypothetical protein